MLRALMVEPLKLRRTPTLLLAVGVPLLIGVMGFLALRLGHVADAARLERLSQLMLGLWVATALPLGTAILGAQVVALEDGHLKHVLTQPVSRASVYLSKLAALLALLALGTAVLVGAYALVAGLAGILDGAALKQFARSAGWAGLGALPMAALAIGLSWRFRWPITIGSALVGSAGAAYALSNAVAWKFLPWSYPLALGSGAPTLHTPALLLTAVTFVGFTALGLLAFRTQEPR
ncbi:ABC transporter permease [Deinococcus maricopensis]|uniref:Uncharacterized protein n=1 Tax=Deinococcus maricopensis (strain DSM 21211 / LMG 22137 / NRRL B-23946 / LB-34) TaxID=709986 RepID=E8UBE1_DEIML|nr:ABC transporter permease [Deinococcus maricopensis]ADV68380.1 hypothetical protein Deima_2751 [Deinococcus maricopensis DSM 21211]